MTGVTRRGSPQPAVPDSTGAPDQAQPRTAESGAWSSIELTAVSAPFKPLPELSVFSEIRPLQIARRLGSELEEPHGSAALHRSIEAVDGEDCE